MPQTRQEFLAARLTGLGGTDVAAIVGASEWANAHDVYMEKLQLVDPKAETVNMRVGRALEAECAEMYREKTGLQIIRAEEFGSLPFRHPDHDFLIANPDFFVVDSAGHLQRIIECKTTSVYNRDKWGLEGTDDIPDGYIVQGLHYCSVLKHRFNGTNPRADFPVFIGNSEHRIYSADHNDELASSMMQVAIDFWNNNILAEVAPDPDDSESAAKLAQVYYDRKEGVMHLATPEIDTLVVQLEAAKLAAKDVEAQKRGLVTQLRHLMDGTDGVVGDTYKIADMLMAGRITYKSALLCARLMELGEADLVKECTKVGEPFRRFTCNPRKAKK